MLLPLVSLAVLHITCGQTTGRCGIGGGTSKIVGGHTVAVDQYPWFVALVQSGEFSRAQAGSNSPLTVFCGATLITARHAVSAAHCFATFRAQGGNWKKRLVGVFGLSNRCTPTWKASSTFSNVIIHPQYNGNTVKNDISLIHLAKDMSSFTPVCFPPAGPTGVKVTRVVVTTVLGSRDRQAAPAGVIGSGPSSTTLPSIIGGRPSSVLPTSVTARTTRHSGEVTIIGYGTTKENTNKSPCSMMEATVMEYTRKDCLATNVASQIRNLPGVVCAGLKNGSADSCQGDSGGPLMYQTRGVYVFEGIVSFGNGCARRNNPGVYTMVSYYRNWVTSRLNNMRESNDDDDGGDDDDDSDEVSDEVSDDGAPELLDLVDSTNLTQKVTGRRPLNSFREALKFKSLVRNLTSLEKLGKLRNLVTQAQLRL